MLGFTLSEDLLSDGPTGVTLNPSFLEHKSPTIMDYPEMRVIFCRCGGPDCTSGGQGLGRASMCGGGPQLSPTLSIMLSASGSIHCPLRLIEYWTRCGDSGRLREFAPVSVCGAGVA